MPSAAELEAHGLTPEDFEGEEVEIWPEVWPAFCLFEFLQTQWNTGGMGGATGLKYEVMWRKMDRMSLEPDEYDQLEEDIRVMEFEALRVINKTK